MYGLFKFLILKYYFNRIQILRIDGYIWNIYFSWFVFNIPLCGYPIWDRVISVIVLLHVPLCNKPTPIKALVWTFIGIYTSIDGGSSTGICKIKAFDKASSDFAMFDALTPSKTATEVN